jgi:hypothetical protein
MACRSAGWIRESTTHGTELSDPAIGFGCLNRVDRQRPDRFLRAVETLCLPDDHAVGLGVIDGHRIRARAALVASDAFPSFREVLSGGHLNAQLGRGAPDSINARGRSTVGEAADAPFSRLSIWLLSTRYGRPERSGDRRPASTVISGMPICSLFGASASVALSRRLEENGMFD